MATRSHRPWHGLVLLGYASAFLLAGCASAERGLELARDGKALACIVVSESAGEATKRTAAELAGYLGRITGATFDVQAGDGSRGIVLGTLAEFPDPALRKPLAIRGAFDGKEAYAIRTEPERLRLIGATEMGVSHAAWRLLEHLGCRWFFPAGEWEVVPSRPTLAVRLDETDRPAVLSRRIWWGYGCFDARCQNDYQAWARRNRMASSRKIHCGHAWQSIIAANRKTFDAHPEYLALVKDKRRGPQFCVSNPEVRKIAVQWVLDQFRRRPGLDMVSVETSDGSDHCQCEPCRKLGNISDRAFGLANEIARAVAKAHPGKGVGMYAYNDHCEPPSFPLEPNVYIQSTAGFIRGRYTFEELMTVWPKVCRDMGFYEYLSVWLWDFDMPARGNGSSVRHICKRMRRYAEVGATSIDCESGNNWGPHGRGYYVANRLMWRPGADVKALLKDFYEKAFGPAAAVMERYYERLDRGNEPLVSEHLLALALEDLAEASRLARRRPDVLARLGHLKQYLHYVRLRWDYDRAADKDAKRELARAALTHAYRNRYTYMNHWAAMRQPFLQRAAKQFDRAAWLTKAPWKDAKPTTPEETEAQFREDRRRFRKQAVRERTFSADLVPSGLTTKDPPASRQAYQRGARYALLSRRGEPLEVEITTGVIAWYRDRPEARYAVTDGAGKEVAGGRLPQDGKAHALKLPVPAAGLYWLDFDDQAAGWGLRVAAGRAACLALRRASHPFHMGHMQRMHFYVPTGTKRIDYYWKGGPHEVRGPEGKVVSKVTSSGAFVRLPVPPGADGKAWSLTKLCLGHLWFFNVPNYLAASPDALLIPREAAGKARRPR